MQTGQSFVMPKLLDTLPEVLAASDACERAQAIARNPKLIGLTLEQTWGQWRLSPDLLWIAATIGVSRGLVTLAACDCARLALPFLSDDYRFASVLTAIELFVAEKRAQADIVDALENLSWVLPVEQATDLRMVRLSAAKRMVTSVATTTWLELPELADAAADAAVQTYRASSFEVSADLVRSRIPWFEVEAAYRSRSQP